MNSLLQYEGLGGQVQMIYMDPPYDVRFGSNFQPFVRRRDVKHGDDTDLTREPEMVQAYRDTWELGLHSYLTYLRDRLLVCRELLHPSGSIFVQISDENLHHVRELMDEVFGAENFVCIRSSFEKTGSQQPTQADSSDEYLDYLALVCDRDLRTSEVPSALRDEGSWATGQRRVHVGREAGWHATSDGPMAEHESRTQSLLGARLFHATIDLTAQAGNESLSQPFEFEGRTFFPAGKRSGRRLPQGLQRLDAAAPAAVDSGRTLAFQALLRRLPAYRRSPTCGLTRDRGASPTPKIYVVQTNTKVVQRCLLMTTDPGDLVLDPTCGSGTTAYVAEQWGRRWITIDTSRVPLALARQRLLTATFPYYELRDHDARPGRRLRLPAASQNSSGEEVGGIVPHVTLKIHRQ